MRLKRRRLPTSLRAYLGELWSVVTLIAAVGISITAGFEAFGLPWVVPPWVIWIICTLILIVANFMTYHRMRLKLLDRVEAERTELHLPKERRERVYRIRDLAGEVMHHISLGNVEETRKLGNEMLRLAATIKDLKFYKHNSLHDVVDLFRLRAEDAASASPDKIISDPPYDVLVGVCDILLEMYPSRDSVAED